MNHIKILFMAFNFLFLPGICSAQPDNSSNSVKNENTEKKSDQDKPPRIGNFALQYSQQPSPLMSFGQNLVEKNKIQGFARLDKFEGKGTQPLTITPSIFYGVTDDLTFSFNVPRFIKQEENTAEGKKRSSGVGDVFLQGEYSFYSSGSSLFEDQANVVGNVYFPTGSYKKEPPTGSGSSSFFLGVSLCRTYTDWIAFTSHGTTLKTAHNGIKDGNELYYECGIGKNFFYIDSEWIVTGMVEANGLYTGRSKVRDSASDSGENIIIDPNSGGNTIFVTPSIFISNKKALLQVGFGVPVKQHLFGDQKKNNYLISINFGWLF